MDQRSFATPHGFSQLTTSFIVSESLGIHHTLFVRFLFLFTFILSTLFYSRVRHSNLFLVNKFTNIKPS